MAESKAELKSLLMKVKEEREKAGLKPNIQKTKIMASGPITSWDIDGETVVLSFPFVPKQNSLNFTSKEQVSFNSVAAVTICSDFGAQKNKV